MTEADLREFLLLVQRMRQAQKDYFAHRERETLELSKSLERQVDQFIENVNNPNQELF